MYEEAVTVNMVETMGWNKNARFYCFANSVYDENGDEITLNPGRTWVQVMSNAFADKNVIE